MGVSNKKKDLDFLSNNEEIEFADSLICYNPKIKKNRLIESANINKTNKSLTKAKLIKDNSQSSNINININKNTTFFDKRKKRKNLLFTKNSKLNKNKLKNYLSSKDPKDPKNVKDEKTNYGFSSTTCPKSPKIVFSGNERKKRVKSPQSYINLKSYNGNSFSRVLDFEDVIKEVKIKEKDYLNLKRRATTAIQKNNSKLRGRSFGIGRVASPTISIAISAKKNNNFKRSNSYHKEPKNFSKSQNDNYSSYKKSKSRVIGSSKHNMFRRLPSSKNFKFTSNKYKKFCDKNE